MSGHHHHNHNAPLPDYPNLNYGPGNKWIKDLTKNRLGTFVGGHFSDVNLSSMLFVHRVDDTHHVKLSVWSAPGRTKPSFQEAMKQEFKPAKKGDSFGPSCMFYFLMTCRRHRCFEACRQYEWPVADCGTAVSRINRTTRAKYIYH